MPYRCSGRAAAAALVVGVVCGSRRAPSWRRGPRGGGGCALYVHVHLPNMAARFLIWQVRAAILSRRDADVVWKMTLGRRAAQRERRRDMGDERPLSPRARPPGAHDGRPAAAGGPTRRRPRTGTQRGSRGDRTACASVTG